jgi:hypothetical protein
LLSSKRCCPYCRKLFRPDPRAGSRQKVCSKAECQKKRKKDYQKKWCEENPTYFHNHYKRVKEWLKAHPDYLKNYRRSKLNGPGKDRIKEQKRKKLSPFEVRAELEARIVGMEQLFKNLPCCDIQDVIEGRNVAMKPFCGRFTHG